MNSNEWNRDAKTFQEKMVRKFPCTERRRIKSGIFVKNLVGDKSENGNYSAPHTHFTRGRNNHVD